MKTRSLYILILMVAACTLPTCILPAIAQPDVNNGAKAVNPPNRAAMAKTPEQRLRRELQKLGVAQLTAQDALLAYATKETAANADIIEAGRKLNISLRAASLTDTQAAGLLNDYEAVIEENRARRTTAQADLVKTKNIDISKMPKVAALFSLMGIYGDGPVVVAGLRQTKAKIR